MASQQQTQTEQKELDQQTLEDIKERIHLSNNKLLQLTYSEEKYINTIISFNDQAKTCIQQQSHEEALVYLAEAERVLQYGASCGKSIDRNLIISILHNEACCYYRQNDLQKAASYLEAIIYNITIHNNSIMSSPASSNVLSNRSKGDEFYFISVQKKIQLIHYYLRYCTVNSQAKKRDAALKAGQNVIKIVKSLFFDLMNQNPKINFQSQSQEQITQFMELMKKQRFFLEEIQPQMLQQVKKLVIFSIHLWQKKKITEALHINLQKHITNYSISQVIQILPVTYIQDSDVQYNGLVNAKVIMRQLLHASMGYFTISTEYRLLSDHRYQKQDDLKQKSEQYKLASLYHLLSILFLSVNLNCDLLFMKQVIKSYQHHYKTNLKPAYQNFQQKSQIQTNQTNKSQKVFIQAAQKIILQKKKSKYSKQNDLLLEKITKLKQKQKTQMKSNINDEYGTLNSSKVKCEQKQQKKGKKRSISKNQIGKFSQKKLFKDSMQNQSKSINNTKINQSKERSISISNTRKRSISKDSGINTKPIHLNVQRFNTITAMQRTNNQYQITSKKPAQQHRKRISSVSSINQKDSVKSKQITKNTKFTNGLTNSLHKDVHDKHKTKQKHIQKVVKKHKQKQLKTTKQIKTPKQGKQTKQQRQTKPKKKVQKTIVVVKKKKQKEVNTHQKNYYL